MTEEFDPLDYANLTRQVVEELMRSSFTPLSELQTFTGAGVYALFYKGDYPHYQSVSSTEATDPIYVGKAVPSGGRKGLASAGDQPALFKRLEEHSKSIDLAGNLDLADFMCRHLVVKPVWIVMAEKFLIEHYQPLWNACIDGFGLHDPGSGRHPKRSHWDTLHLGREASWTATLKDGLSEEKVLAKLAAFISARPTRS